MLKKIESPVSDSLEQLNTLMRTSLGSDNRYIDAVTNYILSSKGKQMRPLLVLLAAALNGEITERTLTGGVLAEFTHVASLVHDDVIDEAFMRRGQLSTNAIWRSKSSVLAGDFIFARTLSTARKRNSMDLLEIIIDAFEDLSKGELMQMDHAQKLDMTEELYYEVINKKTASLLSSCGAIGAKSVDATPEVVERMSLFGRHLGMAFQIKDDILDYTVDARLGKPTCHDLAERKITLPLIYLIEKSSPAERKALIRDISRVMDDENIATRVQKRVVESGGMEYAHNKMCEYRDKAIALLDDYPESQVKQSLLLYCDYILDRSL